MLKKNTFFVLSLYFVCTYWCFCDVSIFDESVCSSPLRALSVSPSCRTFIVSLVPVQSPTMTWIMVA